MSYTLEDLVERQRRRWMQPWALQLMSPADRQADLERWRERLRHRDHGLWNYHAAHAQRLRVNASPQLSARRQIELSAARGAGPSLNELLKLKWDAAALRVQLAVIKHEIVTRKAQSLPPLTEADAGWQIILRNLARYEDACSKAGFKDADRKAGFNPDQPRVPAGHPAGGQWTSEGGASGSDTGGGSGTGGGINDPRILSDATPDNDWKPGAQYAQDTSSGRYSVDLLEEHAAGGHAYREHVGKSDDYLLRRARGMQLEGKLQYESTRRLPADGIRAGSFSSLQSATSLVNSTLSRNSGTVDLVASGIAPFATLYASFDSVTGKEAYSGSLYSAPIIRETYGVRVFIMKDTTSVRGFRVHTAYPTRE